MKYTYRINLWNNMYFEWSKELSLWNGSFDHQKQILKLMRKNNNFITT